MHLIIITHTPMMDGDIVYMVAIVISIPKRTRREKEGSGVHNYQRATK